METDFHHAALAPQIVPLNKLESFWPPFPPCAWKLILDSIKRVGLMHPLIALEEKGQIKVLAGLKRLEALRELGYETAPVVLMPSWLPRTKIIALALADNHESPYNAAETALIWRFLIENETESAEALSFYLGLENSPKIRQWCLKAATLPAYALKMLAEGSIDLELAAHLATWEKDDLEAILGIFETFSPSKQKKKQWLDYLEDISRREKLNPKQILTDENLMKIFDESSFQGRPATENAARQHLWARRHPCLAELFKRRGARLKALGLPRALKLELDPALEDSSFSFHLNFKTLEEFNKLLRHLSDLKESHEFQSLVDDSEDQALFGA